MLGTDAAAIARLRAALVAARYDSTGFKRALGQEGYVPKTGERPAALAELDPADPLAVLIPLFLLELPVPRADVERAVPVGDAVALGLVEDGPELRPLVRLVPSGQAVFVSDLEHGGGPEHVLGVTPSSALLGNLATKQPVERAPDLGTGCGTRHHNDVIVASCRWHITSTRSRRTSPRPHRSPPTRPPWRPGAG